MERVPRSDADARFALLPYRLILARKQNGVIKA